MGFIRHPAESCGAQSRKGGIGWGLWTMGHLLGHPEYRRFRQGREGIEIPYAKGAKPSGRLSEIRVRGYP